MSININKMRENLIGLLFVMLIIATGIQPVEAAQVICEKTYTNDNDWLDNPPTSDYIKVEEFQARGMIELEFNNLKSTLVKVPTSDVTAEAIDGVDSIHDLWSASNDTTDMYFMSFTENRRGKELYMVMIADYRLGYPRTVDHWYICR